MKDIKNTGQVGNYFLVLLVPVFFGCSSTAKTSNTIQTAHPTPSVAVSTTPVDPRSIKYTFRYKVISSVAGPGDELYIDTTGQMTFNTQQKLKSGLWKTPTGFAYLEPDDGDTLFYFIRKNSLFEVDPTDVKPQCPTGDIIILWIYRADLKKSIKIETNTCAVDFNLLSGEQRKLLPALISFVRRIAERYRPMFPDR